MYRAYSLQCQARPWNACPTRPVIKFGNSTRIKQKKCKKTLYLSRTSQTQAIVVEVLLQEWILGPCEVQLHGNFKHQWIPHKAVSKY